MTEGDFEALIRMEVTFARKKGEYYACYEFGTAITPDSDQMMRIGTLAMVRLLLRCGSFRACYSKLSEYPQNTGILPIFNFADLGPKTASASAQSPKFDDFHAVFPGKQRGKQRGCREKRKGKQTGCERKTWYSLRRPISPKSET